jgi:hypothetical protein
MVVHSINNLYLKKIKSFKRQLKWITIYNYTTLNRKKLELDIFTLLEFVTPIIYEYFKNNKMTHKKKKKFFLKNSINSRNFFLKQNNNNNNNK